MSPLSANNMQIANVDATGAPSIVGNADTEWSPPIRPDVLVGPEQRKQRQEIEAALFGSQEAVVYGRYRLLNRLGEGGMGVVYAAYDDHLERKVALKLIRPSRLTSAEARERTLREARALARLSHPNVVHVYEVGELEGQLFVAMEFLAGPTLRTWHKGQVRAWRDSLRLLCQAGEGLAAAHAEGIVHRDFKPQNAMLGADGRVRVLDFGIARLGEAEAEAAAAAATARPPLDAPERGLTMTGTVLGTPAYMAPEQFRGEVASERSDQFSFCVALYEALYGQRPFREDSVTTLIEALAAGRVLARPRDSGVPQRIHTVLLRGLAVDPAARWSSMRELLAALERDPGIRLRRTLAALTLVAVTGTASYTLARPTDAAVEVCPDARAELDAVWGAGRASAVREAVRASHGDDVLAIVEPELEQYAAQWTAMRNDTCLAHAEGRQSTRVFDMRTACLDQRLASLDALVEILENTGQGRFADIAKATSALPGLGRCGDIPALLAAVAPPEDEALRTRVQGHRETLARAQVREDAGHYESGLELVAAVLADEAALVHEPLLAEAYLHKGSLEMYTVPAEGARSLDRALWAALATGHAPVAAQASSKRIFMHGVYLAQQDRVTADLPMTMALNRRVSGDVELYAEYLNNIGVVHSRQGDYPEARRRLEEARDLRAAHDHPQNWRSIATINNLGRVAMAERRYTEALELVRDSIDADQVLGPLYARRTTHELVLVCVLQAVGRPREALALIRQILAKKDSIDSVQFRLSMLANFAGFALENGDPGTAREHLTAARALVPGNGTAHHVILSHLMLTAALEGDAAGMEKHRRELTQALVGKSPGSCRFCYQFSHARALAALGRTREELDVYAEIRAEIADSTLPAEQLIRADIALALGTAHRRLGDDAAAERELSRALAEFRALVHEPGPDHAKALYELGELALARRRWDEARAHLTEAVSSFAVNAEPDYPPLARARFALARALTGAAGPAPSAAHALADAARQALVDHDKPDEARTIEAWLVAHATAGPPHG
jgi:tetratricopeptide (TPR) repeat protein/tRNA A-37 threonylcarbamoyl transferase component Bud32